MRAAIYSRVSTADQSADNQHEQLRQHAAAQGWALAAEYIEIESGARSDRPQLRAMLEAARRRRFDVLLFWSLDRLTREGAARTLEILNRLHQYGVRVRSYTEEYLDSCGIFAEAVIAILAAMAQQERHRISERTRAGMERARKAGRPIGRPRRQLPATGLEEIRRGALSLAAAARAWQISPDTLRRRLRVQPSSNTATDTPASASAATSQTSEPAAAGLAGATETPAAAGAPS
jgi:DNA invertase Pin-like site-specific DNA recombinase